MHFSPKLTLPRHGNLYFLGGVPRNSHRAVKRISITLKRIARTIRSGEENYKYSGIIVCMGCCKKEKKKLLPSGEPRYKPVCMLPDRIPHSRCLLRLCNIMKFKPRRPTRTFIKSPYTCLINRGIISIRKLSRS
ncbi:hypothetical protein PUN28_010762 [Cardiocondyla obscurior]|uniref:Ribosomal protein L34 n=1 Tax=Cardiocondyla obscurior TaxID=286306 RepID=A0AAW2FHM5_9HYME